ncbi:MAG TPA: TetR/AcrR family transcriptional regulator [Sphingomicrobium sp.]|nr:TetR/AcrR family transcriptional regulator [Sphingomicrobium sp.]
MAASAASPPAERPRVRLDPGYWVEAARNALISGGISAVKVEPLAASLGVTVGSFYWHFQNRDALYSSLLDDWRTANSAAMARAAELDGATAEERFNAFINVWVTEDGYSSAYDAAVRDWARTSDEVRNTVHSVDALRVSLLKGIFLDLGYDPDRAEVRAQITYFHQVGYYALDLRYDEQTRLRLRPLYFEALREGPGRRRENGST